MALLYQHQKGAVIRGRWPISGDWDLGVIGVVTPGRQMHLGGIPVVSSDYAGRRAWVRRLALYHSCVG